MVDDVNDFRSISREAPKPPARRHHMHSQSMSYAATSNHHDQQRMPSPQRNQSPMNRSFKIQDLNYFDGINAIREEQNSFYDDLIREKQT